MNNHLSDIDTRLESLTGSIINTPRTNDKQILSSVYDKIVVYIILNSGGGTPDQASVVKETRIALASVFHVYSVKQFLNKSISEKREQLKQLTNIVTGIRLFYWHNGEYGDGFENIPDALVKGLDKSLHDVEKRKKALHNLEKKYTDALFHHFKFDDKLENPLINNFKHEDIEHVKFVKSSINLLYQYMTLLSDIQSVLKYAQLDVNKTNNDFHEALVDLQKFTKYKNKYIVTEYVPTDKVVHKFKNVASLWKTLWKYLVSIHFLNDLEETLNTTFNEARQPSSDLIAYFSRDIEKLSEQRKSNFNLSEKEIANPGCYVLEFSPHMSLKFNGFSTLFVILEGFLVPSNLSNVIEYKNEYYSFSSQEEMSIFCKDIDGYMTKIFNTFRQYPELMDFFEIKETSMHFMHEEDTRTKKCETGIQTELHPIKNFFDKNYHFNAYELMRRHRKQRQDYLNSNHKATKTCSVEDVSTQTYEKRTVSTQECDKATSMPRPLRYVYGLRGFNNDSVIQDEDYVPLLNIQL